MVQRYTLQDFYNVNSAGFEIVLSDEVISQINNLVKHVGSPNYIRTPVFQKAPKGQPHSSGTHKKKRDIKSSILAQEEWDKLTKHPVPGKTDKNDNEVTAQSLRSHLNKLTDKTLDDITEKIVEIIEKALEENNSEHIHTITTSIFDIASSNKFFSGVYADLYSVLYTKYEIMQGLFEDNYSSFLGMFEKINYVAPEVDYDAFCNINKENDRRRSLSTFYLNLYCSGVIPIEKIEHLLTFMMNKLLELIEISGKSVEVEEYTENIAILYKHDMEYNPDIRLSNQKSIRETILFFATTKNKTFPSLTNKCIFKYMDVCDM